MNIIGRVEDIHDDIAYVTLFSSTTGERKESQCQSSLLSDCGIKKGDEFQINFVVENGGTVAKISYLPPKEISKETVRKTREEYEDRWNNL